jgi:glycosyltransferase involved in cell wall biosynthesis
VPASDIRRNSDHLLVCFSHLRWNFVFQRPQHLLMRAGSSYDVLYIEEPLFEAGVEPRTDLSVVADGVTVCVPVLPTGLNTPQITKTLRNLVDLLLEGQEGRRVLWYYTPMALPFTRHLSANVRIYDNMDELSAFRGAHPRMIALEREMFRLADVVFTGGMSLYEAKRSRHRNIYAFPSSIDAKHFGRARRHPAQPSDQAKIAGPRLGFFGVIDERMDLDLVAALADLRPEWQFVMIGPVVKIDPSSCPRRNNIHWLGARDYQQLPLYLGGWDVGIMPFAINEATRFISPTKTPEFLAAGVPVVSTAITDVVRPYGQRGLVEIASTAQQFAECAERLLSRPNGEWLDAVDQHLSGSSWDLTWAAMDRQIQKGMSRQSPRKDAIEQAGVLRV